MMNTEAGTGVTKLLIVDDHPLVRSGIQAIIQMEPDLTVCTIFVAGGEGRGLRPGVQRACSTRVAIPLAPEVESLNVSVAVGVLLFEAVRQRRGPNPGLETS